MLSRCQPGAYPGAPVLELQTGFSGSRSLFSSSRRSLQMYRKVFSGLRRDFIPTLTTIPAWDEQSHKDLARICKTSISVVRYCAGLA